MLNRIQAMAMRLKIGKALAWLIAALPLALGYASGFIVKIGKLIVAAFLEGFEAGVKL
jgi:hypothetical protein